MAERRFLQGFLIAFATLGLVAFALDLLLVKVGEIDLPYVVNRQVAAPDAAVLFSSGISQHAFTYKLMLYDRTLPPAVGIGSSRAMELHARFFAAPFMTFGGATSNVTELEGVVNHLVTHPHPPQFAVVVVDPWWFNDRYAGNRPGHEGSDIPDVVSVDLIVQAARATHHGNWIARSLVSKNLGIYAILEGEGYARDGSYRYAGTVLGTHPSDDPRFVTTLARIDGDRDRFEKNDTPSDALLMRGCAALRRLANKVPHVVMIAAPFAVPVWKHMMQGGYGYIAAAYVRLRACVPGIPLYDFANPATIQGGNDCEYYDGLHGGDVTYARMLRQVAADDPKARPYIDVGFLDRFIVDYSGRAGGITLLANPDRREADFLALGCVKS